MRKICFLVIITLFSLSRSFGQDNFAKGIEQLCSQLEYELSSEPYEKLASPKLTFVQAIQQSASEEGLTQLKNLDFSNIETVKYANLKSIQAVDNTYSRITYQEWTFQSTEQATVFFNTLESVEQQIAQFHINKGGLMWWHKDKSIFFMTSSAFFVTFQYDQIRKILKPEW